MQTEREQGTGKLQASTVPDFAKRNGISRGTAYNEVKRGRLRISKVGAKSLIFAEDEDAWRALVRSGVTETAA
jgi:predicted site-specific integrase-resolvase